MASYLTKIRKQDLICLCSELQLTLPDVVKVSTLKELILQSDDYDIDTTKAILEQIAEDRKKTEELERLKEERLHELAKIAAAVPKSDQRGQEDQGNCRSGLQAKDINKLVGKLTDGQDVKVFLALFERQVERIQLPKEQYVTHLLGLLPLDVVHIITKETDGDPNDYACVKSLLLKRYKLTTEDFRRRFFTQKKLPDASWRDFAFQMKEYLEEWMEGTKVSSLADLKELFITNQIKFRASEDVQKHFLDKFPKMNKVSELVDHLEEYDALRVKKRPEKKTEYRKTIPPHQSQQRRNWETGVPKLNTVTKTYQNSGQRNTQNSPQQTIMCWRCNSTGHRSFNCALPPPKNNSRDNYKNFKKEVVPESSHHSGSKKQTETVQL